MKYQGVAPTTAVRISVAEAANKFAEFLERVRVDRTEFEIEEKGQIVARLSPVEPTELDEPE